MPTSKNAMKSMFGMDAVARKIVSPAHKARIASANAAYAEKENAKRGSESETIKKLRAQAQKAVDEFMRAGVKASNAVGAMNKAIVMSGGNKGMVDWHDVCDSAKTSGGFKL